MSSAAHSVPVLELVDAVDDLQTTQDALLGLETLIEAPFGSDAKLLKVERDQLYALVAVVNTRMVLSLDRLRQALRAVFPAQ